MMYSDDYWSDISKAADEIPDVNSLYNKTILITGGTGLVCSSVVDIMLYLNESRDAKIKIILACRSKEKAIYRFGDFVAEGKVLVVDYDATSTESIDIGSKVDYLIHGASNATPSVFATQPVETILANVLGLHTVLRSALLASASRVLYVSSSEVYGSKQSDKPYLEDNYGIIDILNQRAAYPLSKRTGESLCIAYGIQHGLDTVIARPGHIYGPIIQKSDNRASAQFARKAKNGEDIVMKSKGGQLRSYCHAFDCASAMLAILLTGEKDNAYNISNPNSICTISELAQSIAKDAGVKVVFEAPSSLEKNSYNLMDNSSLSSIKLENLGWKPIFDLESGVHNMLNQFNE
ncbi:NAD-dependent epimerase/dehydratase family protein [Vibrio splendidus]|uniref:NAD-dependent epimerase/dehydratase family protein n=1 Tax=Vibrio splendidus TaxID=29497 RepID=UPI001C6317AB|nr:NAD-dependent epimerase/dehydratase family protein [Vibrio splendidus]